MSDHAIGVRPGSDQTIARGRKRQELYIWLTKSAPDHRILLRGVLARSGASRIDNWQLGAAPLLSARSVRFAHVRAPHFHLVSRQKSRRIKIEIKSEEWGRIT